MERQKNNRLLRLLVIVGLITTLLILVPFTTNCAKPKAEVFELVLSSMFPGGQIENETYAERYIKPLEEQSGGRIKIKQYAAGELVPPPGQLDAVSQGNVDIILQSPPFDARAIPENNALSLPFAMSFKDVAEIYYDKGLLEMRSELYEKKVNVKVIGLAAGACGGDNLFGIFNGKKQINKLEDMKGLMLYSTPGIPAMTIKALGATPLSLPMAERVTAIQTGVADGGMDASLNVFLFKTYEQMPYATRLVNYPLCMMPIETQVNLDTWNKLPADLQTLMKDLLEKTSKKYAPDQIKLGEDYWAKLVGLGVKVYELPNDEAKRWREACVKPIDAFVDGLGPEAKKMADLIRQNTR